VDVALHPSGEKRQLLWFLLTSTVRPHAGVNVTVADESVRRRHYVDALAHWLACPLQPSRIVLVENSGEDLERLAASAARGTQSHPPILLSAPLPGGVIQRGKGAAEAAMIDYALSELDLLEDEHHLFKVTGRLYVRNIRRIIPRVRGRREIILRGTLDRSLVDTRFFGASGDVWRRNLRSMPDEVEEDAGVFIEHVVARRSLHAAWADGVHIRRFAGRPAFSGCAGTSGLDYGGSLRLLRHFTASPLEALLRRMPPTKQF
jgi:hypothetical protein